jgi:hypothetical protein
MKNLKYVFLSAVLPMALAFNTHAQVKPVAPLKIDTAAIKRQLKAQPQATFIRHDFAPAANTTAVPVSVVKVSNTQTSPSVQIKSSATTYQPGSIHPTPLPSTTFQPAMITSPGGTVSSINSQGVIIKKN